MHEEKRARRGIMAQHDKGLEREDQVFEEIAGEDESALLSETALLHEDEAEDEFVQGSIDADDLATGFDAVIAIQEVDVDADTQGDEGAETNGVMLLTQFEVDGGGDDEVLGDEVELDLEDALATGRTVAKAPKGD